MFVTISFGGSKEDRTILDDDQIEFEGTGDVLPASELNTIPWIRVKSAVSVLNLSHQQERRQQGLSGAHLGLSHHFTVGTNCFIRHV
jgi:hypothetical protein